MSKQICNNCRHCVPLDVPSFRKQGTSFVGTLKEVNVCKNELCTTEEIREMFPNRHGMPLDMAQKQCDREGDGIFVYFEPKNPAAGAAAEIPHPEQPNDWRKDLNKRARAAECKSPHVSKGDTHNPEKTMSATA